MLIIGCNKDESQQTQNIPVDECLQKAVDNGKVYISGSHKMLHGGENAEWDFDITNWSLHECQLHYGLGREFFDALIDPQYNTVAEESERYHPQDRFIILLTDDKPKVYSINLLSRHEVINEVVEGTPVMVVYCILADLAAVYDRSYCDTTLTFGLSGYTYFDQDIWDGVDGFVLWNRETESLWWPLIDKAVSGEMQGTTMTKYTKTLSWEITWAEIEQDYSDALVLATGQTMETPENWPHFDNVSCSR